MTAETDRQSADSLIRAGISPLVAMVLASRGLHTPEEADTFLSADPARLHDPLLLPDIRPAVSRLKRALADGEHITVYGDYDVDGITATCLLTEYLRAEGGRVSSYIPGRIEEGYGLNPTAIHTLHAEGVTLIVTVDCGITAVEEARLCRRLGIDLIITDHHACREEIPEAVAVIDPHRPDSEYPWNQLAGVGVAFKLAAALAGDQRAVFDRYCDLVCLGTVADVMPLLDENRCFVSHGIRMLNSAPRPGLRQLIRECASSGPVTATSIGYVLSPRINAAGRLGRVELATELILTTDRTRAAELAQQLCRLNRQRQLIEQEIYASAVEMLAGQTAPDAIVLAGLNWHQGVVGIVASRLAEEYGCPVFLICLDGDRGKASSRSYGGFNLFAALEDNADLLESFGGHELAAGFTILADRVETFRERMCARARAYYASGPEGGVLNVDCVLEDPSLLTARNVSALDSLEPCGSGFPRPVFRMERLLVEQLADVGSGKHLRLKLSRDGVPLAGIFFSTNTLKSGIAEGDLIEAAFCPQMNEYRGFRSVQLNLTDLRVNEAARLAQSEEYILFERWRTNVLRPEEASGLIPVRDEFVALWRYLNARGTDGILQSDPDCLARCVSRYAGIRCSYVKTRICLEVFSEMGLVELGRGPRSLRIRVASGVRKVDLDRSGILIALRQLSEGR